MRSWIAGVLLIAAGCAGEPTVPAWVRADLLPNRLPDSGRWELATFDGRALPTTTDSVSQYVSRTLVRVITVDGSVFMDSTVARDSLGQLAQSTVGGPAVRIRTTTIRGMVSALGDRVTFQQTNSNANRAAYTMQLVGDSLVYVRETGGRFVFRRAK